MQADGKLVKVTQFLSEKFDCVLGPHLHLNSLLILCLKEEFHFLELFSIYNYETVFTGDSAVK